MPDQKSPWDQLSTESAQVLFCDLQNQIVARSKTTEPDVLRQSAGVLLQLANLFGLPATLSVVPEQEKAPESIPELRDHLHNEGFAAEKLRASASPFLDPATVQRLAETDRKVLILAGFVTEVVVLHAALDARKQGYQVIVAVDACGGMSERTEQAAVSQLEGAGVLISSVVSVATKLAPDFTTEKGKQMFALLQQLRLR
jgi:nicotinamidase-related amidase